MGYVKVRQEDLDAIDQSLDESTTALESKILALDLPEGDLGPIQEDLNNLKGLHTPPAEPIGGDTGEPSTGETPPEQPPVTGEPVDPNAPRPDQTLPGDLQ